MAEWLANRLTKWALFTKKTEIFYAHMYTVSEDFVHMYMYCDLP